MLQSVPVLLGLVRFEFESEFRKLFGSGLVLVLKRMFQFGSIKFLKTKNHLFYLIDRKVMNFEKFETLSKTVKMYTKNN